MTEYEELTTAQKINAKKGRMEELALGILPVKSDMSNYAIGILPRKSNLAGFIPTDRHTMEFFDNRDGSVSHSIVKKPRR
jgi:hypothetical protein